MADNEGTTIEAHEMIRYTADVVLLCGSSVLLIRRDRPPYAGRWALPGGHVDRGETARQAAVRELREETGITVPADDLAVVGVYDEPDRDPRGRYISVAFTAIVGRAEPFAGDDASLAQWHPIRHLIDLAFDHLMILRDAMAKVQRRETMAIDGPVKCPTGQDESHVRIIVLDELDRLLNASARHTRRSIRFIDRRRVELSGNDSQESALQE